jgi:hypothetical protein
MTSLVPSVSSIVEVSRSPFGVLVIAATSGLRVVVVRAGMYDEPARVEEVQQQAAAGAEQPGDVGQDPIVGGGMG